MTYRFSLRFYDQTDAKVAECITRIKQENPLVLGHEQENPKLSMSGVTPSHQIYLLFSDQKAAESMVGNDLLQGIYMAYASPGRDSEFSLRRKGDPAYAV